MSEHLYDRNGQPISFIEYCELMEDRDERQYRRVAEDEVGDWWISTVWLGIDHNFGGNGPPLIFETMIFWHGDGPEPEHGYDGEQHRYPTELLAIEGHLRLVEQLTLLNALQS